MRSGFAAINQAVRQLETPTGTREKLIIAAEQLFAERGIQDVSLRQINNAAGQRNASATHYHFGSRDTLVRAIFEFRMTGIDQRRFKCSF